MYRVVLAVLLVLLFFSEIRADEKFRSTSGEEMWIKANEALPNFTNDDWQKIREPLRIDKGAPVKGTYAIGHIRGKQLAFEVFIKFHGVHYLYAIVYYLNGRTPRIFIKRGAKPGEASGVYFEEKIPYDEWLPSDWLPDKLFPDLKDFRFI